MASMMRAGRGHDDRAPLFTEVPEASWGSLLLATAAVTVVATGFNLTFRTGRGFYTTVHAATGHLVRPALIAGLVLLAVTFAAAAYGRLRPRHLGWRRSTAVPGLAATAVIFLAMQLVEVIATLAGGDRVRLSASWSDAAPATVGVLLGYALGIAPAEETFFRGLLLPQLRLKFARRGAGVAVGTALVVSQVMFALYHLPGELLGGSSGSGTAALDIVLDLGRLFLIGMLYAALYLRTGNLFLLIGVHTLADAGTTVVAAPLDPGLVVLGLAVVTLLATGTPLAARLRAPG